MNRRTAAHIALLPIAIWLISAACPAAAPRDDAADAQALKAAQAKLAALAREGASETPPKAAKEMTSVKKKKAAAARNKKRVVKGTSKGNNGVNAKGTDRRLTQSQVQGILSTTRDFSGSDLSGLNLVGLDLSGAKFNRANLRSANLGRTDLSETDLELADLTGADLRGASLNQARVRGTRMAGARMEGAMWVDRTVCREGSVGSCME